MTAQGTDSSKTAQKITVAAGSNSGMVLRSFCRLRDDLGCRRKEWTALNIRRRVGAGGHNNTEMNPVFRGMVRQMVSF